MPFRGSRRVTAVAMLLVALVLALALALAFTLAPGSPAGAAGPQRPVEPTRIGPIVWSVLAAPIHPVRGTDGRLHLV